MALNPVSKTVLKILLFAAGALVIVALTYFILLMAVFNSRSFFIFTVPFFGFATLAAFTLLVFWKSKRKITAYSYFGLVLLMLFAFASWKTYKFRESRIPKVSVMDFDLKDYAPYTGKKTVSLNKRSSLIINEDFPFMDGATALYPVYASFAQALNPDLKEEVSFHKNPVQCSNTPYAYNALVHGRADVIFVAEPSRRQLEFAQEKNLQYKFTPIGKEAFVFFVNSRNPVNNLTTEQVRGIYSGRINNWSQVGGRNENIKAFQRPEGSGSQTALEKLMKDDKIMSPTYEDIVPGMGGIVLQAADYKNYRNAIGFSFRFFVNMMMEENNVKILSIDGVHPSPENIENGSYPLSSEFYAVTVDIPVTEDKHEKMTAWRKKYGDPIKRRKNVESILEWVVSPEGQELVEKAGYVPVN